MTNKIINDLEKVLIAKEIKIEHIAFCQAHKNTTLIFSDNGEIYKIAASISQLEEYLRDESDNITRIHRSYIISKKHVAFTHSQYVIILSRKIPVGEKYRISE